MIRGSVHLTPRSLYPPSPTQLHTATPRPHPDDASLSRRERERLLRRRALLVPVRAEFGKGALYNYVPGGKDELLRSVLDELFGETEALMGPLLTAPLSDTEAFRRALHAYLTRSARFYYLNRDLFHLVMREAWRLQLSAVEESRAYLHAQVERSVTALSGVVERAVVSLRFRPRPRWRSHSTTGMRSRPRKTAGMMGHRRMGGATG